MRGERLVKSIILLASIIVLFVAAGMVLSLVTGSIPAFRQFGIRFIFSSDWIPTEGRERYGALPFISGTLMTSIIALIICLPLSFSVSVFLGEYFKGTKLADILRSMVDLLAGIPSIVYGLWGFYVLRPVIVNLGLSSQGFGIFTSSLILAVMIIPYASSLSNEVISMVPVQLKEAAYSLGATRREVIFTVIIPSASSGMIASYILALGRALGETMAVTMLIGNANIIPKGLFSMGNTMASVIANQFGEAEGLKLSSLIAIGLLLFIITGIVNYIGKAVMKRLQ
jgi:phosphate transport system permease protein